MFSFILYFNDVGCLYVIYVYLDLSGFRHGLFDGWRVWSWLGLDYTDFGAVSLTSLKTVVRFYFSWQSLLFVDVVLLGIDGRGMGWWVLSLCVVGHVHVYLSYLDGIEIGLVFGWCSWYVMVSYYLENP